MIKPDVKYSYNDIAIVPSHVSYISSRSQCDPFTEGNLPIFTAPMSSIISDSNYTIFKENNITPIIPRNIDLNKRISFLMKDEWVAVSLTEFKQLFINNREELDTDNQYKVCVDIANGHMNSLLCCVRSAKKKFQNLIVMTGNIANPSSIVDYILAGVDYVRLGIGAGAGCITSSNTGIHYPMVSLIDDTYTAQEDFFRGGVKEYKRIKLIADGGIRNYSDVVKAMALGADYVMIGGLFAQCKEACGKIICKDGKEYHTFYGMASRDGQIDLSGAKTKTAEGICREVEIKYTLPQWKDNMIAYLKSAMSYCNATNLQEFRENGRCIVISNNTKLSINQ